MKDVTFSYLDYSLISLTLPAGRTKIIEYSKFLPEACLVLLRDLDRKLLRKAVTMGETILKVEIEKAVHLPRQQSIITSIMLEENNNAT